MRIINGTLQKDVELEMLLIDGFLEDMVHEMKNGANVQYRILKDGQPIVEVKKCDTTVDSVEIENMI